MRRAAAALAIFAILAVPTAAAARTVDGHVGVWQTIDCAQWESADPTEFRCDIWGDGSTLQISITGGRVPVVTLRDTYSDWCSVNASSHVWTGTGYGTYTDPGQMETTFLRGGCGSLQFEAPWSIGSLYWDEGSDQLWNDPDGDGWGYHFWRVAP